MRIDLVPPQPSGSRFLRWTLSEGDRPIYTAAYGSWLIFIPVAYLAIIGLVCLAVPFLAVMPGQPKLTQKAWLQIFLEAWPFGALILYAARRVWVMAEPYRLILDLATRHYHTAERLSEQWESLERNVRGNPGSLSLEAQATERQ